MLFTVAISQLPFFVACIATLARCMNCRHLAMSSDEEQWNTRPAVSAVKRRAELSSTLTKTLYACDNLHCKTWQFLRAARQILGMGNRNHGAMDTAMASDPALVWDKTRLAFETNAEL